MIKINHLLITLFLLIQATVQGQHPNLDSLRNQLEKTDDDTTRINLLIQLAYGATDNPDEQLSFARKALEIGKNISSTKHKSRSEIVTGIFLSPTSLDSAVVLMRSGAARYLENNMLHFASNAFYIMAITFEVEKELDSAINAYKISYDLAEESRTFPEFGSSAYALANIYNVRGENVEALKWGQKAKIAFTEGGFSKELGQVLNQIGIIYDQKGLFSEALDSYLEARDLAMKSGDVNGEILTSNNLGVIYDNMNNTPKALRYYSDALEKARMHNLTENEATLLNNLSYIHLTQGDTLKSIELLKQSLAIDLSEIYPCFSSYPLEGMGSIYVSTGKLDSAEMLLTKALKIASECEDAAVKASVKKNLGNLYSEQGKIQRAVKAYQEALQISRKAGLRSEIKEILELCYQFHKKHGNQRKAMEYLEKYQALSDSIYNESNIEKAAQLAAEYEFRKQVKAMNEEREVAEKRLNEEIREKSFENRLVLLALGLFILLAVTLGRSYYLIQKQNQKLTWLNDEKNKLMGVVAHDLRNPLNMIIGLTPLFEDAAEKSKDKNLNQYLDLLKVSSGRMREMIDRVLDISAIENMKVNLKLKKTDLTSLTYESIHNFDVIASQKEISIEDNIDNSTQCYSLVDESYLVQVIDNLLSNAIKFSDKGKKIEVSLVSENNHHKIIVRDEGPGITEEEQKNLFEAYTTLSAKPTAQERSTGLGLSIAQKFVEAMGGRIACHSIPGEGTTFSLIFEKAD